MRTTPEIITHLEPNEIFVFGSNREGRHGKGAALQAMKFGAEYGNPSGLQGSTYAIITKELRRNYAPVTLDEVQRGVWKFLKFAKEIYPEKTYLVVPIGCSLAGFRVEDIAPMFSGCPLNVVLPLSFQKVIYLPLFGADLD